MNNNTSEFGKEIGLLHEVAITGRKVGADVTTYSFLASNALWFGRFSNLSRHLSVMLKNNVNVNEKVDAGAVTKLIQDITVITADGCVVCNMANGSHRYDALPIFAPQLVESTKRAWALPEGQDKSHRLEELRQEELGLFHRWLEIRLKAVGIHPAEVAEFCPSYHQDSYNSDPNRVWMFSRNDCCSTANLTSAIQKVVKQRDVLGSLDTL